MAFLAVFLTHAGLLPFGFMGVTAFFVLSGYLIIPILMGMRRGRTVGSFLGAFYGRRALRIFPLYFAYLFAALALSIAVTRIWGPVQELESLKSEFFWALTYTYDFYHATAAFGGTPLVTHFWSLAVEEQFYLIAPLVIWFLRGRGLVGLFWAIAIAGPLLRYLVIQVAASRMFGVTGDPQIVAWVFPFAHLDAFAIGGLAALAARNGSAKISARPIGMVAGGVVLLWVIASYPWHFAFLGDGALAVWGYSLFCIAIAALLMELQWSRRLGRDLDRTPLGYLGLISYGLYVFHMPVIWIVRSVFVGQRQSVTAVISLALTVMIAAASYHWMERPALDLKDRFFPRHAPDTAPDLRAGA